MLYLFDNNTSKLILLESFVEIGFYIWKILKTTKFERVPNGKFPFIKFKH